MNENFPENLRLLCSYYKSIADVCRRLAVNRPQFNRYLSGTTFPSNSTLRRICDFFGVEEHEILLPHSQFRRLLQVRPVTEQEPVAATPEQQYFDKLNSVGQSGIEKYVGYYFEYYLSMAYPGKVLRTLVCIERQGNKTYYQRTERLNPRKSGKPFHGLYKGVVQFLGDRIFLHDYETLTNLEMTQTVLYPTFKNRVDRLTGLRLGVSGSGERMPCCTRVMLEFIGKEIKRNKVMPMLGLYDYDDEALDDDIRLSIKNDIAIGEWHFRARF
ncbi:helix-turn-helix transcriptional regulator [Rhodanobacter aciditrophus]|uniref:Helix-turn-helix transcriptional regulator n=1 Tax=Rhodanobacter aciditrophus TaxID=1623218 RepID=A0ABW4B5W6_9GAMM